MNTEAILGKMTAEDNVELFVALCQTMTEDQLREAVREMGDLERDTLEDVITDFYLDADEED